MHNPLCAMLYYIIKTALLHDPIGEYSERCERFDRPVVMRIPLSEMESFAARDGIFLDQLLFSACCTYPRKRKQKGKQGVQGRKQHQKPVKMIRFFMGSVHQDCECFQPFSGVQCTAIALMAVLYFMTQGVGNVDSARDIDHILQEGTALYARITCVHTISFPKHRPI